MMKDFRSVQTRHEKARRQLHSTDAHSISSMHYSSPSQVYNSVPNTAGLPPKTATLKKKTGSRSSVDGNATVGRLSGMSPLNPKRGPPGSGSGSGGGGAIGVSIGGAVASMNVNASTMGQPRPMSPPGVKGRKILGGMRRREG